MFIPIGLSSEAKEEKRELIGEVGSASEWENYVDCMRFLEFYVNARMTWRMLTVCVVFMAGNRPNFCVRALCSTNSKCFSRGLKVRMFHRRNPQSEDDFRLRGHSSQVLRTTRRRVENRNNAFILFS